MAWTFLNNLIDVTGYITADATWRTTATITGLPTDTKTIWLRVRQTTTTAQAVGATHPDITFTGTGLGHTYKPQYFMIGVKDRTFRYYCSGKTNQFWEILAYSNNDNEAYTTPGNYPVKTPATAGSYEDKSFAELPSGAAFAAILIDQNYSYQSGFRYDGASYDEYYYKVNDSFTTAFLPLQNNVGEIKVGHVGYSPCYLTAGLLSGAVKFDTPQNISIGATGWSTVDASAIFPAGASLAILECRNVSTSTARTCALRNTGSSQDITAGVAINYSSSGPQSQFRLVGLNSNRQFDINVNSITDVLVKAYGYISNDVQIKLSDQWKMSFGYLDISLVNLISIGKKIQLEIEIM